MLPGAKASCEGPKKKETSRTKDQRNPALRVFQATPSNPTRTETRRKHLIAQYTGLRVSLHHPSSPSASSFNFA